MALGVTACNEKIYAAFVDDDKRKTFFHGHSFTANPLACTAALASLDLLLQTSCRDSIERICRQQQQFLQQLTQQSLPGIKNLRQLGTILAFEIEVGKDEYLNNISHTITQKALSKGVYLRPLGNTVYLMPPYCFTQEELQTLYTVVTEIVKELLVAV